MQEDISKESIIVEYLAGGTSYRELGTRYGYSFKTIQRWVIKYERRMQKQSEKIVKETGKVGNESEEIMHVKLLQADLQKAQLLNKVLNEMIDIAEQDLKVSIRKKPGIKRS